MNKNFSDRDQYLERLKDRIKNLYRQNLVKKYSIFGMALIILVLGYITVMGLRNNDILKAEKTTLTEKIEELRKNVEYWEKEANKETEKDLELYSYTPSSSPSGYTYETGMETYWFIHADVEWRDEDKDLRWTEWHYVVKMPNSSFNFTLARDQLDAMLVDLDRDPDVRGRSFVKFFYPISKESYDSWFEMRKKYPRI